MSDPEDPNDKARQLAHLSIPESEQSLDTLARANDPHGTIEENPNIEPDKSRFIPPPKKKERKGASIPSLIGPYRILQSIGQGGMGQVFLAEQQEPVKRCVALKVINTETPSDTVLARFEAERQALSMMDHQNIARVLDAGIAGDGRPYFAMELVKGIPITEYCDQNRLTPNERLELFVQTCRAVQHAHQKGVIHRDLKPSNILVTLYDGKPIAKVIDFGLAKAINEQTQLTNRTLFTQHGQVVGTLEYMSPEQAELNSLDIDTRTDIYSLGVILYELLTGSTPIGRERLRSEAFDRILAMIREEEAPRPSTRLSNSGDAISGISEERKINPKRLGLMLRGDLDWIAMKAIEKDRTRRYEGAAALGDDVERFLSDEPIEARPPTIGYRLNKAFRKHKARFLAVATIATLLIAGLVGGSVALYLINSQYQRAEAARHEAVTNERMAVAAKESASQARMLAESARLQEATARKTAELAQQQAEAHRLFAESASQEERKQRQVADSAKRAAEEQRHAAELARQLEAKAREEAEADLQSAKAEAAKLELENQNLRKLLQEKK